MNEEKRKTSDIVGKMIAEKRKERGISIYRLAELSGVSVQNITKLEHDKYNPSLNILGKLVEALECEIVIQDKKANK